MLAELDSCPFCTELMNPAAFRRVQHDWPFDSRIVHINEKAFVIPGVGPQVYPYLLVLTRRHIVSLATTTPVERRKLIAALDWLLQSGVYPSSSLTVFEHGGCGGNDSASCVDHAHMHVIDGTHDLPSLFRARTETAPAEFSGDVSLPDVERYVFVGRYAGGGTIHGAVSEAVFPKQFCRRLLATLVGGPWNWRLKMHEEWVTKLVRELGPATS
jgi:diadenosine tetraphosphate (Ap4A) HIT family hydrolase